MPISHFNHISFYLLGLSLKRRKSSGSIQLSNNTTNGNSAKIVNRRKTVLGASRRRSGTTPAGNLTDLLPKNAYPKIVLTKSISGTNLTGGATIKTRQSTGNIPVSQK